MLFWIITGVIAFVAAVLLARAIVLGRTGDEPPAAYDLRVYRDQLKEVEKDLARGVINAEDAERTKAEISRRILVADTQIKSGGDTGGQPATLGRGVAVVVGMLLVAGSVGLYVQMGAPGYGDLGLQHRIALAKEAHENRPGQAEVEARIPPGNPMGEPPAEYVTLVEKLREAVAERPADLQGYVLLARNEAALGNFKAAYEAQRQILSIKGQDATAQDYVDYADLLILATAGYVSPEAEKALLAALSREPRNGAARYYMGLMLAQTGRPDQSFRTWNALLREGPADAPWIAPIRAQIEEMAARAGVEFTLPAEAPAATRGPTAEDMQAAQDMTPEERQEMIRGMVAQLSDRLATEGGTPEEWARLISAYGILGELRQAQAIWNEAQQVFKDRPRDLATVRDGAKRAGLLQ